MSKYGISRVIMHRDHKITVLQSMFDGKLHDEFVEGIRKLVPDDIKIIKYKSGLYNGGGSAYNGGFARSGISFMIADPKQAPQLRKVFLEAKNA